MVGLQINLNGDDATHDLVERGMTAIQLGNCAEPMRLTYRPKGMTSGMPSVAFLIPLPGRSEYVVAEFSAKLLIAAADLIRTKAETEGIDLRV
jgi:hypothetical protein